MPSPGITKRLLAEAMKTFMQERPLTKISVGDLVDECGLNRNSFYYHFKDKYDLVNWIFSRNSWPPSKRENLKPAGT